MRSLSPYGTKARSTVLRSPASCAVKTRLLGFPSLATPILNRLHGHEQAGDMDG